MTPQKSEPVTWVLVAILALFAAACGGRNIDLGPTGTPTGTPTSTPTQTPTQASGSSVTGLLVLQRSVSVAAGDALGAPPAPWAGETEKASFDRALSHANWSVIGADQAGVTGDDGSFVITGLAPGRYTLQFTKTLDGNLAAATIPFTVGDGGAADIVAEMSWGQAKSTSTYTLGGRRMRDVVAPNGTRLVTREGRVLEFGDWSRTFTDPDGTGTFACSDASGKLCGSVEIAGVTITTGPSQLVVGQTGSCSAVAQLSDGSQMDVTYLADWHSAGDSVAIVDSWGTVTALAIGSTTLTASVGTFVSSPWPIEVLARPPLKNIYVQNASCIYPMGAPSEDASGSSGAPAPETGMLPVPNCTQVLQIGATIQFRATGEFENGYYEDLTTEVQWQLASPPIGDVVAGLFTATAAGTTTLTAALNGIVSDPTEIRVVTQPTVVALSIYANNNGVAVIDGRVDASGARPEPCFDCQYSITVLRGDQLRFRATAQYDTGAWEDVTDKVAWRTSDQTVATIDTGGLMTAVAAGDAAMSATLGDVTSNTVGVRVVNEATLQSLSIYQEGGNPVVGKGDQRFFHATGYYDVGFARDVTKEATWRSGDTSVGTFDTPGVFTARGAGTVQVWVELAGQSSNQLSLTVFETSELTYCDPNSVNRSVWSDDFNRVVLESDCAQYRQSGVVTLRYTVTETQPHGGVFDPCLDLYAYQGTTRVRTIREEGCGDPFLPAGAPGRDEAAVKYQLRAFWDLKDDTGHAVPPGLYTIYGRFYLYYDPVVSLTVTVLPPDGTQPGLADLAPVSVTLDRPPVPGGCLDDVNGLPPAHLDVCVANQGTWAAGPFVVSIGGNAGSSDDKFTVLGLAAGEQRCFARPALPAAEVIVVVDATNAVPESDKTNNSKTFFLPTDTPLPTCTPGGPTRTPTATPLACCAGGQACIPELPPCPILCCPPDAPCATDVPPCQPCGGLAGLTCTAGFECVDDPTDSCAPPLGADCPGICVPQPATQCVRDEDCPAVGAACMLCPDGSAACPRSSCEAGTCKVTFTPCATPAPSPVVEGACFKGSADCTAGYPVLTSQAQCCMLLRYSMSPLVFSWCPAEHFDPNTNHCSGCAKDPCTSLSGEVATLAVPPLPATTPGP